MTQQYDIKEELLEMFHRSAHLLHRSGPHLRRHGRRAMMPPAQGRLMRLLEAAGPMTQRSLGDILDIRSASLSELLGKLEKPGWIERRPNENDKRTTDITLTQEGRNMLRNIGNERAEMAEEVFGSLNEDELRQLHSLLGKLIGDWETRFEDEEGRSRHGRRFRGESCLGHDDHGPGFFQHLREHFRPHHHHHGGPHDHDHHPQSEHERDHSRHKAHGRCGHRADFEKASAHPDQGHDDSNWRHSSQHGPDRSDDE
ncbi:hypothetical protein C4J81_17970 [Deltaproteobacteria bacterium Smac51]|nr:hypothetical protein C4J81_17970 [Deltaproteobacteria bacterium Smac51]